MRRRPARRAFEEERGAGPERAAKGGKLRKKGGEKKDHKARLLKLVKRVRRARRRQPGDGKGTGKTRFIFCGRCGGGKKEVNLDLRPSNVGTGEERTARFRARRKGGEKKRGESSIWSPASRPLPDGTQGGGYNALHAARRRGRTEKKKRKEEKREPRMSLSTPSFEIKDPRTDRLCVGREELERSRGARR